MAAVDRWNDPSLRPPPICSYQWGELRPSDVQSAHGQLQLAKSVLTDNEQWNSEKFVISRLLFKLNNSLSIEKWYKGLKKVEKCMRRFKDMEVLKHTVYLTELWTSDFRSKAMGKFFLPSRQMVEFWLVKLQGGAQLMRQIASYCIDVYKHVTQQLSVGHFIHTMLLVAALVSRVWVMSRSLALHMCQWYSSLRSLLDSLKGSGIKWLPDDSSDLPDNLESWLDETSHEEHADIILKRPWVPVSQVDDILNSLQPASLGLSDDEDASEAVIGSTGISGVTSSVDDIGEPVLLIEEKPARCSLQNDEDVGEAVMARAGAVDAALLGDNICEPMGVVKKKHAKRHGILVTQTVTPTLKKKTKKAKNSTPERKLEKQGKKSSKSSENWTRSPQDKAAKIFSKNQSKKRTFKESNPELQQDKTQKKMKKKRKRTEDFDIPSKKKRFSNNRDAQKFDVNTVVDSFVEKPTDNSLKRQLKKQKKKAKKKAELHHSNNQSKGTVGSSDGSSINTFQKCPWTLILQDNGAFQTRPEPAHVEPKRKKKKQKQRKANIDSVAITKKTLKKQKIQQEKTDNLKSKKLKKMRRVKKGRS